MSGKEVSKARKIHALKVQQWLVDWEHVKWNPNERRSKPQRWFYLFSISAPDLKALSGIYARSTKERTRGTEDLGIQRRHEKGRSEEIARFVKYGYPWSELSKAKRESNEFSDLQKPGWLPTAIVVNILQAQDDRLGKKVDENDLIGVEDNGNDFAKITLPKGFSGKEWKYKVLPPLEVIDGQHRLWAFENASLKGNYELPVVAFVGLDRSWQAYLFYTINIKPKKINASLAFDLYPLLRTEDWLTKFEGDVIYRESRAQELVDLLWSQPQSPWHKRINMLGEPGYKGSMVSQSAWIHSLLATYIKSWEGRGVRIGGLFGSPIGSHKLTLPWSRPEQAAFLIVIGQCFQDAIKGSEKPWAKVLRRVENWSHSSDNDDPAFYGQHTLLNQDQGIRAFLYITNDLCYVKADALKLADWGGIRDINAKDVEQVNEAINSLKKEKTIMKFLKELSSVLATYDWRASSAPGLEENEALLKAAFRGSGGYKELRRHLLRYLSQSQESIAKAAKEVLEVLGY
jgi:DGQHR domain-containing protein